MDRESMRRLRLDRRLIRRRGWLSEEELELELSALPDVSHKIAHAGAEPSEPSTRTEEPTTESQEKPSET